MSVIASVTVPGKIIYSKDTVDVEFKIGITLVTRFLRFDKIQKEIYFRKVGDKEFSVLLPEDALEYHFTFERQLIEMVSLELKDSGEKVFLRNLISGKKMSFFKYYKGRFYYMEDGNGNLKNEWPVFKKQSELSCVRTDMYQYNETIRTYFSDCKEVLRIFEKQNYQWGLAIDAVKIYNRECGK